MGPSRLVRFQIGTFFEGHMGSRPIAACTGTRIPAGALAAEIERQLRRAGTDPGAHAVHADVDTGLLDGKPTCRAVPLN